MNAFMDADFLLSTQTARMLYHEFAENMPIIDFHCHIDPRQIYEDTVFSDLTQVWLGGDHYKWRVMRANGIGEEYITGKRTSPYQKFEKWAETVPKLIGNPLYHWTHLELQRYFGIRETLSTKTCRAIWEKANEALKTLSVRRIIRQSNVLVICTTDDPADSLQYHSLLAEDKDSPCLVLPAFRPDLAMNIDKPGFLAYLKRLGDACGIKIISLEGVKQALKTRLDAFVRLGCRVSDHGLDYVMFETGENPENAFLKATRGEKLTPKETDSYKTELMCALARMYREQGVVMQLHYGALRNVNPILFDHLGPDTGNDACGGTPQSGKHLGALLGKITKDGGLPKTVVYSLNPCDSLQITSVIGCFQEGGEQGRLQHGSAWWFNDTRDGMEAQLRNLANQSVLANFIGMLTDSRSFLSYTRHEYFRRVLCSLLGSWVENGEYPNDLQGLGHMVKDICCYNAQRYFGFDQERKE